MALGGMGGGLRLCGKEADSGEDGEDEDEKGKPRL